MKNTARVWKGNEWREDSETYKTCRCDCGKSLLEQFGDADWTVCEDCMEEHKVRHCTRLDRSVAITIPSEDGKTFTLITVATRQCNKPPRTFPGKIPKQKGTKKI